MIFGKLDAWVTSADGRDKLTEYLRRRTENNTVECWIPSTEGASFGVKFKHADPAPKRCRFGLILRVYFDGEEVFSYCAIPSKVTGEVAYFNAKHTGKAKQSFQFGKLQLTDKEDVAPLDDPRQFEFNTIKFVFRWATDFSRAPSESKKRRKLPESESESEFETETNTDSSQDSDSDNDSESEDNPASSNMKFVHEQMAKRVAHGGSAVLGPSIPLDKAALKEIQDRKKKQPAWCYKYTDKEPVTFIFRYAPNERLVDKGVIRSSAAVPAPEVNTINDRDSLAPEINPPPPPPPSPPPPPPPSLCQPKAEPDTIVLSLEDPINIEIDTVTATVDTSVNVVDEPSIEPVALLESKVEQDITPSFPTNSDVLEHIREETTAVELPRTSAVPQKRLRDSTPIGAIDVDMLSSDDEIIVLDMKPSKAAKRARTCRCKCGAVGDEDEDAKPKLEDVKPKIEDIKPKIENIKHESEDIRPGRMIHGSSSDPTLDLWRLGC